MKKKALLLSDELFLSNSYSDGKFRVKQNKILTKLKNKFDFDNISSKQLTSIKAKNYIKEFIKHYNYSHCIISLKSFDDNLKEAVEELIYNGIRIILVTAPNASKEDVLKMKSLCNSTSIKYIVYDDAFEEQSANKINSFVLNLCA
ncbi:MAG: hypothetical protein IKP12_04435 [Acholeplasmatales bacterium]|nr:hypothetical protein [Acholeplasmatales bacterium]